nr:TraI domain-containing protein [Thiorhodococcus mannitoliphagus]
MTLPTAMPTLPLIERYAAFAHLLRALETQHHRGAGGLFRHGLEVAFQCRAPEMR